MRGRPVVFNEKEVLEKAQKLFWKKGFTATSLDELLRATGMGAGSFYNAFKGGKREVFRKAVAERRAALKNFEKEVSENEDPIGMIKNFFLSIAEEKSESHLLGCLIVNTATEMAFLDDELEKEAVDILKEVEDFYTRTIAKAQEKGQISNTTDPAILGRYLITLWNGLNVTRRMYPEPEVLKKQIEMQLSILS
ncbi:TetR/AcrR family transcriptional regulator [Desertivirga brevis]|uniref:TetR/AcrR family transcriptional regulator n=1 Tax=Desertivirga brevis TaxID=2810310 RepID=UPI001A958D32|nr:TetR/AcrR family transcriptional regulator [Pedobacter sp. SYSU D00873]